MLITVWEIIPNSSTMWPEYPSFTKKVERDFSTVFDSRISLTLRFLLFGMSFCVSVCRSQSSIQPSLLCICASYIHFLLMLKACKQVYCKLIGFFRNKLLLFWFWSLLILYSVIWSCQVLLIILFLVPFFYQENKTVLNWFWRVTLDYFHQLLRKIFNSFLPFCKQTFFSRYILAS